MNSNLREANELWFEASEVAAAEGSDSRVLELAI